MSRRCAEGASPAARSACAQAAGRRTSASGGGSDGALGIRSVKEAGGVILVQSPQDAAHDSMPLAAIATGVVDFVLPARDLARRVVAVVDRLVPQTDRIVIRTPEVEDQALELVHELQTRGLSPVAWLVDDASLPHAEVPDVPVLGSWSLPGLMHYWRSRVVVHTHGAYGAHRGAAGKVFVNLWHGMPIKRLPPSEEYRRRTDLGIATAPVHARHLAETWGVDVDRVAITGLPRNDLLARPRPPRPASLVALTQDRPLAVWLPTFRRSVVGELRVDGRDLGSASQLPGVDPEAFDALMGELGMYGIVKPHPMAPPHDHVKLANSSSWSNVDLARAGSARAWR